jgi:hypothetical protein
LKQIKLTAKHPLWVSLFLALFTISCNKNEEIGSTIQPKENLLGVNFNKSIPVIAHTVLEDSVRTDETILNMIGSYHDPIFGTTTAGMYTQFRLTSSAVSFGANPACDSIVLSLAYTQGFYGDTNHTSSPMKLDVYEIAEDFSIDNNYYSNQRLGVYKNNLLSNYNFIPNLKDSVKVGTTNYAPHLRVKLKKSLGDKIIDASSPSDLNDNPSFIKFFKGLYITANKMSSGGSIVYINSTSSISKLTLYYHNDSAASLSYNLVINENCARFNTFEHYKYFGANSAFKQQISGDTSLGNNLLYLQAMAGTKVRLKFRRALDSTFFDNTPLKYVAINKAEIVIKDSSTIDALAPPATLSLVVINTDNTLSFLPDVVYGEAYFGGTYNSTTQEYRFNVSKYLQNALLKGSFDDNGLYMVVSGSAVLGNRAIIKGPQSLKDNMRLEIIYTKLK